MATLNELSHLPPGSHTTRRNSALSLANGAGTMGGTSPLVRGTARNGTGGAGVGTYVYTPSRSTFNPATSSSALPASKMAPPPRTRVASPPNGGSGTKRHTSPPSRPAARSPPTQMKAQQQSQQGPKPEDLENFNALCRRLYYDQDSSAARAIDAILAKLPVAHRQTYAKAMAAVRSDFHHDMELRQRAQVIELLESTKPGGIVIQALRVAEGGTAAMRSAAAKKVRAARLDAFVKAHSSLPGTQPFMRSLQAMLYLQSLQAAKGGAGQRRVTWEIDTAVFSQAGGGDWMKDAIEILKGVLGFTDEPKDPSPDSYFTQDDEASRHGHDAHQEPAARQQVMEQRIIIEPAEEDVPTSPTSPNAKRGPPVPPRRPSPYQSLRTRAISDPFIDPDVRPDSSDGLENSQPMGPAASESSMTLLNPPPMSPSSSSADTSRSELTSTTPIGSAPPTARTTPLRELPPSQLRIFTIPSYLCDPELDSLMALFPESIKSKTRGAKFNSPTKAASTKAEGPSLGAPATVGTATPADAEAGMAKLGHGELRIGTALRDAGFRGTGWERFILFFKHLFG